MNNAYLLRGKHFKLQVLGGECTSSMTGVKLDAQLYPMTITWAIIWGHIGQRKNERVNSK